jgi:hypothetical protein
MVAVRKVRPCRRVAPKHTVMQRDHLVSALCFSADGEVDVFNRSFLLRSDNGLVFTSRTYTRMVRSYRASSVVHHAILSAAERDD